MGCFSWLDCRTGEQIRIGSARKVYVLLPKEFGGGHIEETRYDGQGNFGSHDIYELVADWNKALLSGQMLEKALTRNQYCGLWPYEKEAMEEAGATPEEIRVADEKARDEHYNRGLKRYTFSVKRLEDFKNLPEDKFLEKYGRDGKRETGIDIACYDWQNATIPFPIKITHDAEAVYEDCQPSKSDENQGCD